MSDNLIEELEAVSVHWMLPYVEAEKVARKWGDEQLTKFKNDVYAIIDGLISEIPPQSPAYITSYNRSNQGKREAYRIIRIKIESLAQKKAT